MNSSIKRTSVQILLGIVIVLLLANIIYKKYIMIKIPSEKAEVSSKIIKDKFLSSVNSFGLKKEWIVQTKYKEDKNSRKKQDSVVYSYKISVPQDLPIPVILNEINSALKNENVKVISKEEKINGKSLLSIYSKNNLKLAATFVYIDEMRRKAGFVGIIISGLENINDNETTQILNFPEQFGYLITPSKESEEFVKKHVKTKKEYILLLNDDIDELKYKLEENYSEARLKGSIRSIIGSFPKAAFMLVDDNSNLFKSSIFNFISNEIEKRKIKLIKKSSLLDITGESQKQMQSTFSNLVKSSNENWGKVIIVPAANFSLIEEEIIKLRKIGFKFINPSRVLLKTK